MINNDEESFRRFLGKRQSSSIALQSTDEHEIIAIIDGLNCRKSTGYIGIPTALFKATKFLISRHLARVLNNARKLALTQTYLK